MSLIQSVLDSSRRILDRTVDGSVTLYNPEPVTVIYVDSQNPATINSQPINPGAQLVWTQRECYAVCAAGESGNLLVSENDGNLTDPNAIASAIIDQGLAQDIANAIQITTVPAGDNPTILLDLDNIQAPAVSVIEPAFDCAKFQSLIVTAIGPGGGSTGLIELDLGWSVSETPSYDDDFTRPDNASLSVNAPLPWAIGGTDSPFGIKGNHAVKSSGTNEAGAYIDIASDVQTVSVTLGSITGFSFAGPVCNGTNQATDGYAFVAHSSGTFQLFRNASNTGLSLSGVPAPGDVLTMTSDGNGHIKCYVNGALKGSYTDPTPLTETTCGMVLGDSGNLASLSAFHADPTGSASGVPVSVIIGHDTFQTEKALSACIPCRGTSAVLTLTGINNDVDDVTVKVFGSYRQIQNPIVDIQGDEWGASALGTVIGTAGEGFVSWKGTALANTSYAEFPPSRAGRARFTFTANDPSTEWSAWVADYETSEPIAPLLDADTVATYSQSVDFIAPRRPLLIHVNNLSAANQNFSATITYTD